MIHEHMPVKSSPRVTSRHPDIQKQYDAWRNALKQNHTSQTCPFCDEMAKHRVIQALETVVVIEAYFPYAFFDGQAVLKHYLIVPLRHGDRFSQFTDQEAEEYQKLLTTYHERGFSSMTRSAADIHRSIPGHLHTHLLAYN